MSLPRPLLQSPGVERRQTTHQSYQCGVTIVLRNVAFELLPQTEALHALMACKAGIVDLPEPRASISTSLLDCLGNQTSPNHFECGFVDLGWGGGGGGGGGGRSTRQGPGIDMHEPHVVVWLQPHATHGAQRTLSTAPVTARVAA